MTRNLCQVSAVSVSIQLCIEKTETKQYKLFAATKAKAGGSRRDDFFFQCTYRVVECCSTHHVLLLNTLFGYCHTRLEDSGVIVNNYQERRGAGTNNGREDFAAFGYNP